MAFSNLDKKEGIYDQTQRYRFTNIDDEEFVGKWNSKVFVRVPAGASATLPESQAINFAKELCTRVMFKEEKNKFIPNMNEPTWEQSQKTRVGIPIARDPYEKRILQKMEYGEETPEIQAIRSQLREELLADLQAEVSTAEPSGPKALKDLSVVADSRTIRSGKEFEGVSSLK